MQRQKSQSKKVQNIRDMIAMRFRITHQRALKLKNAKNTFFSKMFASFRGKITSSELQDESSAIFSLKFVEKLTDDCLLIGNQYQLNAIGVYCMNDFTEANSHWQIAEEEFITNVYVSPKVRSLFLTCTQKLYLYSYCLESCEESPNKEQSLIFTEYIHGVYLVKRNIVLIMLQSKFQVFEIEFSFGKSRMTRIKAYNYFSKKEVHHSSLHLISIPNQQGSCFQIFFKDISGITIFEIFSLKIEVFSIDKIQIGELHKFCEVPQRYIKSLQISHYRSDIYLVYVGLQLYAVRNNYFLDNIITNTSKLRSFIKQFSSNYFFLYHKERFQFYKYQLNQKVKPERFQVQCLDTIPITKPGGSYFLDIKQLGQHLIFVFQQPKQRNSSQLAFWLGVGDQIDIASKIDKLYPSTIKQIEQIDKDTMQQKIEMALQIGYQLDSAYLQLWNRSGKASKKDYDLLIATQNYQMISSQIQAKFKKTSLKLGEVMDIMQRSLSMLSERIRRPQQNSEHIRQFAACHFLNCKYQMFLRLKLLQNPQTKKENLVINIQDYYNLTGIEIFKYLQELLSQYLVDKNQNSILLRIRTLLFQFSLIIRCRYISVLTSMIKSHKNQIIELIKAIPELLPIEASKTTKEIQQSLWVHLDLNNYEKYLILQNYYNFENRKSIQQFIDSKFFKVYQWHSHGAFAESPLALKEKINRNNPHELFIVFYEQLLIYRNSFTIQELEKLINHIESNYPLLPKHLRGRFKFYQALYNSFRSYHEAERKKFMSQLEFLRLSEDQLFEIYFQEQRAKKGIFLLKQVEPIYMKTVEKGNQLFLQSMFRFFQGVHSCWSDLKIILNKFNNQKEDFHQKNHDVFEVMVKAILEKVKIGGDETEAGLGEVLSYLENIPFPLQNISLLESLISIQEIHQEEETLKTIKINMSLREILQNGQEVIARMVKHQIQRYNLMKVTNTYELKLYAYKILSEVNYRKSNIYVDKHANFPLKCFLITLMQDQNHIQACKQLLADQFLVKSFQVNEKLIENIVIYLYRKRLYINPIYEQNKAYIDAIVNILEQNNVKRRFLQLSEIYADIFSTIRYKMRYPFFKSYYPTVDEVSRVISDLDKEELMNIDHEEVFDLIIEFKQLGEDVQNIIETRRNRFANHSGEEKLRVMKHELYTLFFMNYMKHGLIKQRALHIAVQIMAMDTKYKLYNIIVPVFLIEVAQKEMIDQVAQPFIELISYYFNFQEELQGFVNWIFSREEGFTNAELIKQFELMKDQKKDYPIFDPNNPLFSDEFKSQLQRYSTEEQAHRYNSIMLDIWHHIRLTREEFIKDKVYLVLYRLLLHNPYVLAQYINRKQQGINVCSLRALLTLIGVECIFNLQKLLQLGESIFSILMVQLKSKILLEDLLEIYSRGQKYRQELKYTDEYLSQLIKLEAEDLIGNSILSFRGKLAQLSKLDMRALAVTKAHNFGLLQSNKQSYLSSHLSYPFDDRDKQYALPQQNLILSKKSAKYSTLEFDESAQRSQLCEHLNYLVKPVFKQQSKQLTKTLAQFYLKLNKKNPKRAHPNKMKSLNFNIQAQQQIAFILPFSTVNDINLDVSAEEQQNLQRSQSLKVIADEQQDQKLQLLFGDNFVDYLPQFNRRGQKIKTQNQQMIPQAIKSEIELCLEDEKSFNLQLFPFFADQSSKLDFFLKTVNTYYNSTAHNLSQRVKLIWDIKKQLLGEESINKQIKQITFRLATCPLINSILYKIENVFSQIIFTEDFSVESLLQLVRENLNEAVEHQEDIVKSADIVGYSFHSSQARQSILMMFLVKLCRAYAAEQDQRRQNHLKDQILYVQQTILSKTIMEAIEKYAHSRNEDLKSTGRVLQYFRSYQSHLRNISPI